MRTGQESTRARPTPRFVFVELVESVESIELVDAGRVCGTAPAAGRVLGRAVARREAGFTLTELMIVVAIVGILALIGVVSYRKIVNSSKVTEATGMVAAVRIAQESYHAEAGQYATISTALDSSLCPTNGTKVANWDPSCSGGVATWSVLPVRSDGPVRFGYATIAGLANGKLPSPPKGMSGAPAWANGPATDWYVVSAMADTDGDGTFVTVLGASWTRDIYVDNEGE